MKKKARVFKARGVVGIAAALLLLGLAGYFYWPGESEQLPGRWYSAAMADSGGALFAANCAVCHGANAEGARDWQVRDADGYFPPPPLDGSAHTWHHPLQALRATIARGGVEFGGQMPGFAEQLNAKQQDEIIAYFQSLWPQEIYATWAEKVQRIETR